MSKRRRTSSESSEEIIILDEIVPGKSQEEPSSDVIYEDVLMEIQNCKDSMQRAKAKLQVLEDLGDSVFVPEMVNHFDAADKIFDKSVKVINKMKGHWMSFDCLPYIPMKHILKYLDIVDKMNLRLTCNSLRVIVDTELIFLYEIDSKNFKSFEPSFFIPKCLFSIKLLDFRDNSEDVDIEIEDSDNKESGYAPTIGEVTSLLNQISERVLKISGTGQLFRDVDYQTMTNCIHLYEVEILRSYLPQKQPFKDLTILTLNDFKMKSFEDLELWLGQLEELCISDTKFEDSEQIDAFKRINFYLPYLKKLELTNCSPEFVHIAAGSAPALTDVTLDEVDPKILTTPDIQIPSLSRLCISHKSGEFEESCIDLISKFSSSLQELELDITLPENMQLSVCNFPKLKKFSFANLRDAEVVKIVKHSPSLKCLWFKAVGSSVPLFSDQPGTLYLDARHLTADSDKVVQALNKPSEKIDELVIGRSRLDMPKFINAEMIKLTKLSLKDCKIRSGFENLLNQCCSTLEELKLEHSIIQLDGEISELKSLKHISLKCNRKEASCGTALKKLLEASSTSLEKLTLGLLQKPFSLCRIFDQVQLSNLKILHVYAEPDVKEKELDFVLDQLPEDMTHWNFWPEESAIINHLVPSHLQLLSLMRPNDLYIDISK